VTVKLGLTDLSNSQSQWLNANATFARLDQLVQAAAIDKDLNSPPSNPDDGALYIINSPSPTGDWSGHGGQLAYWLDSVNAWQFIAPNEGWRVYVTDEEADYNFNGASWVMFSGGGMSNPMSAAADLIVGGASGTPTRLAAGANGFVLTMVAGAVAWAASGGGSFTGGTLTSALNEAAPPTVASSATPAIGAASANTVFISGTVTITGFDSLPAGAVRRLVFTGALTLTHNGTSLALPTAANITTAAGDVAEFLSLGGGNWLCISYLRANGQALAAASGSGATIGAVNVFTKNQSVAPSALISGSSIATDASLSNNFKLVLGANATLSNPTNLTDGMVLNFRIKQDATGSRTLAYGSKFKFPGGIAPLLSTAPNAVDLLSGYYDSTDDTICCNLSKGFS